MLRDANRVILHAMKKTRHLAFGIALVILLTAPITYAGGEEDMLSIGSDFVEFELEAHDGTTVSSADLSGKPFLLFFYPKADTPG